MSERRAARERAFGLIYEAECKRVDVGDVLAELPADPVPYAVDLVTGVSENIDTIDGLIDDHADGWSVSRLPALDRAILRVATYELLHRDDVPRGVVMDEAIELAKDYSTGNSGRFVNGVLAAIADDVRPA